MGLIDSRKIIFCFDQMITGGREMFFLRLVKGLQKDKNFEITVLVGSYVKEPYLVETLKSLNITLIEDENLFYSKNKSKKGFFRWLPFVNRKLLKREIRRYIDNNAKNIFKKYDLIVDFSNGRFAEILTKINHCKKIMWFHGGIPFFKEALHKNLLRAHQYSELIVITDSFAEDIAKLDSSLKEKTSIVYTPIDVKVVEQQALEAQNFFSKDCKYFTCVARLDKDKDHMTLIKAFEMFHKKHPEPKLLLLGDGPKRKDYEQVIKQRALDDCVIFLGNTSNPYPFVAGALANILSSPSEGASYVLLEAMVLKTLNISSDCLSGPKEILMKGRGGLLFPVGDYQALFDHLEKVFLGQVNIKEKTDLAYQSLERYSVNASVSAFNKVVEKLIG